MIIKSLQLKGFTSYINSKIDFDINQSFISTITAPNGFGKSSILEAITTALFYRARGVDNRGTGMDDLVNNESNYFEIILEFLMDNNEYKIIRRKFRGGKHELEFYINNISQTEKIADTQDKINDIIKMNYETFLDTVCIGQGMSGNFMKKKPNERKDVFVEILNLNQFEVLEKYTKELKKDLVNKSNNLFNKIELLNIDLENEEKYKNYIDNNNVKLKEIQSEINNINNELKEIEKEKTTYDLLKQQNKQILKQKNNLIIKINNNKNKLNNLKNDYLNTKKEIENFNNSILEKQNKLDNIIINDDNIVKNNINNTKEKIDNIIKQKEIYTNEKTEYNTKINLINNQIDSLKNEFNNLKNYDKGICDFCGNEITEEHKTNHLNKLSKKIEDFKNDIDKYNNEINNINNELNALKNNYQNEKNNLENFEKELNEINNNIHYKEKLEIEINNIKENIQIYKNKMKEIKNNKNEIEEENKKYNDELNEIGEIKEIEEKTFNDNELNKKLVLLTNEEKNIISYSAIYENKLKEIDNNKIEINEIQKQIDDLDIKIKDHDSLIEAFSKKGIQSDIIANVLPDIENEINNILDILFNNSTTIEFITQKDDKKSKVKSSASLETLDIIIHDKDKDRTYETYSGGERFRIDFACHVGMAKFLAKRAKANIEFFMIDEGLGSQDEEGKENFVLTVNKLSNMFKQIFVITHIDELKDAFDKKIVINKDQINGSIIKMY